MTIKILFFLARLNNGILAILFVLLSGSLVIAQKNEKSDLQQLLAILEDRHNVTFTYADEHIKNISVKPPPEELALNEALLYLEQNTGLQFQQLNGRYITISKPEPRLLTICGVVSFEDTGQAVQGATIQFDGRFSLTSENGYFQLEKVAKDDLVEIRFVGYKTETISAVELAEPPCKKIVLRPQFTTLQEVFISDLISEGIDKKLDGSLGINAKSLGLLPGLTAPDVLQTIQALPGIQSVDERISDINVRGGTNDQNLILWEGIKMYHAGHFFGLISAFNPYLTDKITLIKNGSSAFLGDGVSSTIDIRTDNQIAEVFSGGAGINMIDGDVFAKIPLSKKASLQISARRSVADIVLTPAYKRYFERAFRGTDVISSSKTDTVAGRRENFYFYDTSLKLAYNITNKDKVSFSFINVYNEIEYEEKALINSIVDSKISRLGQHNLGSGISYTRLWNENIKTSSQVYLSSYNLKAINFDIHNNQRLIQENSVVDTGVKLDARIRLSKTIDIFSGYQFFEVGISNREDINNPSFQRLIKKVIRNQAVFFESNFTFNQTNIRIGGRSNYYPNFEKLLLEPRFTLNQKFLDYFSFELLGEMKSQFTTQIIDLQNDFLGVEKKRWILSNDRDVPVIRSKQVSTGIYYNKNDFLMSAEAYHKLVDGIITSSQGFLNQFQFVRTSGSYKINGLDMLISKKFVYLSTWLSYSYANNRFSFRQLVPPAFPNSLDVPHRLTFGSSFQKNNFELSSGIHWHTGKPYTKPIKNRELERGNINYATPNSARLANYFRLDISARYSFSLSNKIRGQVGFSVWNILNRQNIINQYYNINDRQELESVNQYSLGITPNAMLRINF